MFVSGAGGASKHHKGSLRGLHTCQLQLQEENTTSDTDKAPKSFTVQKTAVSCFLHVALSNS